MKKHSLFTLIPHFLKIKEFTCTFNLWNKEQMEPVENHPEICD